MRYPEFREEELAVKSYVQYRGRQIPLYDFPITPRENSIIAHNHRKPCWILTDFDNRLFCPSIIPDQRARGFVFEAEAMPQELYGGPDMFGVPWVYIPTVQGSMVKPGNPILEDVNDWREKIIFPDIDQWDWEGSAEKNREWLESDRCTVLTLLNGCWFERLLSFMDFEGAAMALIDDDQIDAVKELIHETTSLYIRIVDKCVQYYRFDGICIHDDWGSQMAPFFSEKVAREIFLPEMKRFVENAHAKGKFVDLHSCGHVEDRCRIFAEAGFDSWTPMPMNDTAKLYEDFGDRIVIGVVPPVTFDPATATEQEQRAAARAFVEQFTKEGKNCSLAVNYCPPGMMTPIYREELYKAARIRYAGSEE